MPYGIGAGGIVGIAFEVTPGTYVAPTKFAPVNSESLQYQQDTQYRRPIRASADIIGAVAGDAHVEGTIELELLEDLFIYWLYTSRYTIVKTGSSPNFIYTCTPNADAIPARTMSITIQRVSGAVFGYVGCVTKGYKVGINNGMVTLSVDILGRNEASQSAPTATWPTSVPFGVGTHTIEIPTGSVVTDTDTYEFGVEDNAEPQYRLKSTGQGAEFIKYGERQVTTSLSRDFQTRSDYDAFKALTAQSITLSASRGINNNFSIVAPTSVKNTYEVGLGGQGDLLRASIQYMHPINASGVSHTVVVKTQEDIV
jgi:hypothetical protein